MMQFIKITGSRILNVNLVGFIVLLLMLSLEPMNTWSQSKNNTISGIIKDETGEPLIGATVTVRKKQIGTITNSKGEFQLKGVAMNDLLLISYIGMESKAIPVKDTSPLIITLTQSQNILDEVVTVGYGTMKKRDLTGSIKGVGSESFLDQTIMTAEDALKGRVAGVVVNSDNSPGGGISIQIRGSNSMLGGTEPLYVVDGFPIEPNTDAKGSSTTTASQSSLNFINPDDILNMEVLKDASATAIYGARGANGVVLITTKSGKSGTTQVTYSGKFGLSQITKKIEVLTAQDFANYQNQIALTRYYVQNGAFEYGSNLWNPATLPNNNPSLRYSTPGNYPWELGAGTNWQDALYRNSTTTSHTVLVQGGTGDTKMSLSLGYTNQEGILIKTSYERFTLNSSIEHPINKFITISNKFNLSRGSGQNANVGGDNTGADRSIVTAALWTPPIYKLLSEVDLTNPDLLIPIDATNYMTNPYLLATLLSDDKSAFTLQNNLNLVYKITKDLNATGSIAVSDNSNKRRQYWPSYTSRGLQRKGEAHLGTNDQFKFMTEARLNYLKKIGNAHTISAMAAVTFEQNNYESWYQEYGGMNDGLSYYDVGSATTAYPAQDTYWMSRLVSYLGRLNYNYKDRYLLTATMRADGSSRAALDKKFGYFPSFAAAWRITEEPIIPKLKWLNNAKMRFSYGQTGSYPNSPYQSLSIMYSLNSAFNDKLQGGVYEPNPSTPNLSWERTDQYNAGLDLSLLNSYLNITLDFYYKRTHDLLQNVNVAPSTGFTSVLMNLGEVENKGFEFDVNATLFRNRKSSLTVSVNGAINKNKLLSLGNRDYVTGVSAAGNVVNRFMVGQPLGVFWGYKSDGLFRNWTEVVNSAQTNATPGDYKLENLNVDYDKNTDGTYKLDVNGNKIPSSVQIINELDKTVIGDPNPDFTYGVTLNYKYGDFDASMLMTGQLGGQIFWADYVRLIGNTGTTNNVLRSTYANQWAGAFTLQKTDVNGNTYTFGNPTGNVNTAIYPRIYDTNNEPFGVGYSVSRKTYREMNSSYILDGTFMKIQNISLGYTFKKLKVMSDLRVSLSVTNLFTFSDYPGYDPTILSSASPMRRGIDFGGYPALRTVSVNVQAKF